MQAAEVISRTRYHILRIVLFFPLAVLLWVGITSFNNLPQNKEISPQATLNCDQQIYYGVQHCGTSIDDANVIVVDLNDPHIRFQTVLSSPPGEAECNSVNGNDRDINSNCPFPYPAEQLNSMLNRHMSEGAVAIINTDYFGCGDQYPCGSTLVDHGAQGLAVRNGIRLDGKQHGVNNKLAYTQTSMAISNSNLVTIGIPGDESVIDNNLQGTYYNTVAGTPLIIDQGTKISNPCSTAYTGDTCSRASQTAAALTTDGKLILITARMNAEKTADFLLNNFPKATKAIKFDGGGSARMVWLDENQTQHTYGGTTENRPVAEGLLVFSDPVQSGEVIVTSVNGEFYGNPTNSGSFTTQPGDPIEFTQSFPVINFNPPAGTIPCTNSTGVGVSTRPFTDVELQLDSSCITIPAEGNGKQAGVGTLSNFQAVFRGEFKLSGPAQVSFNFYSDDGWILSAGKNSLGAQPSYVSGPLVNPPATGPFSGFSVVGSYNKGSRPTRNDLVVNFPAAGTYPFELDYTECCGGELVLTLTANSAPIPQGASISGTVFHDQADPTNILPGSIVQACIGNNCTKTISGADGQYQLNGLAAGDVIVTAFSPTGNNLIAKSIGPITLDSYSKLDNQDLILSPPMPPPPGTTITSRRIGDDGLPIVFWGETLALSAKGCSNGTGNYQVIQNGTILRTGSMIETSPGTYSGTIQPLFPFHGSAHVTITVDCPSDQTVINFDTYIDPSGVVRSTTGTPLANAKVTLYYANSPSDPFSVIPNGSDLMSPSNRKNPDITDSLGRFGWDVVAGYYKVRAEQRGCHAPNDAQLSFVESEVLSIPPEATDLDLRLECQFSIHAPLVVK